MVTDPKRWMAANSASMLSPQLQARFAELQQVTDPNDPRNGPNVRTPVQQEQITKNLGQFFTPEMRRGFYNKQQTTPGLFGGRSLTGRQWADMSPELLKQWMYGDTPQITWEQFQNMSLAQQKAVPQDFVRELNAKYRQENPQQSFMQQLAGMTPQQRMEFMKNQQRPRMLSQPQQAPNTMQQTIAGLQAPQQLRPLGMFNSGNMPQRW